MKIFLWNDDKNAWLKNCRGISFEAIVFAIKHHKVVDIIKHPNTTQYATQTIIYVELNNYIYAVPCVEEKDYVFLKTAYPDRKSTKKYLGRNIE